ncbi:hypothetical protein AC579_1643 [Pseudocercospora musae]|uniref:YCII-related domain-containing protein n=1 Tax=Pseudocercospora musae TaxID=113226 RepID=A0A139IB29_9PEZI|nr:hypothetical protein AC579_1643 [Pseudocercospora musae]
MPPSAILRSSIRRAIAIRPAAPKLSTRSFAATTIIMGKQEWICILPDGAGKLDARMKVRPQHLEGVKPKVASGLVVMGGATLDEPIKEGEGLKINGSVMMVEADTREEVERAIKEDIYYKEGVWDADKVQIMPFKSAVREPLK